MGLLFLTSITGRDFTTVNALVIIFAVLIALGALLSDIILTIVDPRIRIK
jgi:peptide/nickel transport system permease protein